MSEFESLSDHFVLRMYEFIRNEVQADRIAGTHLLGPPARQRADRLLAEINRRGLFCQPIDWPGHDATGADARDISAGSRRTTSG